MTTDTSIVGQQQPNGALARGGEPVLRRELSLPEVVQLGAILAASKYFRDALGEAQCVVKVLAGMELGVPPLASMAGIHIIEGKPTVSGPLLASLIKRSGKYDFRPLINTDEACEIAFYQQGEEIGRSRWTVDDAKRAGLLDGKNWAKYRRQMLLWRALGEGARIYCADVLNGVTPYISEEMGVDTNADGEPLAPTAPAPVIDVAARVTGRMETAPSYAGSGGSNLGAEVELQNAWTARYPDLGLKAVGEYASRVLGRKLTPVKGDAAQREADVLAVLADLKDQERARKSAFGAWDRHRAVLGFDDANANEGNEMRVVLGVVLGREVETRSTLTAGEWDRLTRDLEERANGALTSDPFVEGATG